MARVEAEIRRKEEEARKAEEARRAEEAKKNQSSAGGDSTVKKGNTNFIWPCPASGRISSAFGDRSSPTEGASTNHKGIDIPAPSGSSIVAAADGKVVISTYSYSAGNYIMIDHGGGLTTVYMHCSQLLVKEGGDCKTGTDYCKGRIDRIFHRASSAFWRPVRRKLCKSFRLCKSIKGHTV